MRTKAPRNNAIRQKDEKSTGKELLRRLNKPPHKNDATQRVVTCPAFKWLYQLTRDTPGTNNSIMPADMPKKTYPKDCAATDSETIAR